MNSPDYWRKRELANIAKDYLSDRKLEKRLKSIYNYRLEAITKEIDSFYQRYADKEGISYAVAKKRVSKHDVQAFQETAQQLVEKKDFSELANRQLRLYNTTMRINRLEMLKSRIGLHLLELSDDVSLEMRQAAKEKILETYDRQAGILGSGVEIDTWAKAEQIIRGSFDGADFSERIWGKTETRIIGNTNILYAEISQLLEQYLINGKGSIRLAGALKKRFDTKLWEAERLARTEIRRIQTSVQVDFMQENGIKRYKFIAEPTACKVCGALDNKVFDLDKMMVGTNASPMHPNCRCGITPVVDRVEIDRHLNEIDTLKLLQPSGKDDILKLEKGSADNVTVRKWYKNRIGTISQQISVIQLLEDKARAAFDLRNRYRTEARSYMSDAETRNRLDETRPNAEFEELVESKMKRKGLTREEALQDIIDTATKSNADVDRELGVES